ARAEHLDVQGDLAAAVAATLALPAFLTCAKLTIQVHGGIGYTYEHDAHLYLRRAGAVAALCDIADAQQDITHLVRSGAKRTAIVELPPEAEHLRDEVPAYVERYVTLPEEQRRTDLVDSGYFVPHWPKPWGRAARAVEQLVIDEEWEGVDRPVLMGSGS